MFKLRASHTKERQIWVDRLRACAHRHNLVSTNENENVNMESFIQVDQITRGSAVRQEGGREEQSDGCFDNSRLALGLFYFLRRTDWAPPRRFVPPVEPGNHLVLISGLSGNFPGY